MKANRPLVHSTYVLLLVSTFLGGRLSAPKQKSGQEDAITRDRPSVLASHPVKPANPNPPEASVATAATIEDSSQGKDDFVEKLAELVGAGARDYSEFTNVLKAWLEKDPLGAIDFLTRGANRDNMLQWIVSVWSRKHPEDASRWLADNRDIAGFDHAVEGLANGIQKEDPASALEWAQMIEDPEIKTRVWISTGFEQFRHDHELAGTALTESGLPFEAQEAIREAWTARWKRSVKRNAQNVASVASAATAAGITFDTSSAANVITQVVSGMKPDSGPFKGSFFGVPGLTPLETSALEEHLRLQDSVLAYHPGEE